MNAAQNLSDLKWACLRLMSRHSPDDGLRTLKDEDVPPLIHWLDVSGLALYFLHECESANLESTIPASLLEQLRERAKRNHLRIDIQLAELRRVVQALNKAQIIYAVRKGFALTPDFCSDAHLRHQVDIDFVINERDILRAIEELKSLDYRVDKIDNREYLLLAPFVSGTHFSPDDIYAIRERRIEIRSVFWDSLAGNSSGAAALPPQQLHFHRIGDVEFTTLPIELTAAGLFFHAMKHLQSGWLRLSWFWELHTFLARTHQDDDFWRSVAAHANDSALHRRGIATVFLLIQRTFDSPLPTAATKLIEELPSSIRHWATGSCDEFLFRERPDDHSPIFFQLTGRAGSFKLGRIALMHRLRRPVRYFVASGKRTLRDDLHRAWMLLGWRLVR